MRLAIASVVLTVALLVMRGSGARAGGLLNANLTNPLRVRGPGNYYSGINMALNGTAFQAELHALISDHKSISYAALWDAFKVLETNMDGCSSPKLADIYSSKCWTAGTEQCGNYKKEGDCYNREHSWPKSWWGGDEGPQYTDLFHLFPSDGYDNARRSNYALGFVSKATYTTDNGSKLGPCTSGTAPSGVTCWEPADEVKGVLARAYFYMSTCYMDTFTCCNTDGVNGALIKPWMQSVLKQWHNDFPPTPSEQSRNDDIYSSYQSNRNPFIDFPDWSEKIDFSVGVNGRVATDERPQRQRRSGRGGGQ